jgi:hypothetical protein
VRLFIPVLLVVFCAGSLNPVRAEITPEAALALARQVAVQRDPRLDVPSVRIEKNQTDLCVALDVSNPYKVNGEQFWKTFTTYEYTKIHVAPFSGIGTQVHATAGAAPLDSPLPEELKPKAMEWVAFWQANLNLGQDARIGARKTKVYLFRFHLGFMGPSEFVGVDSLGKTFRLNTGHQLTPWGHGLKPSPREKRQMEQFLKLFSVAD